MKTVANIIWFIFGGWATALVYAILGLVCYATIIGIPIGKALFQYAKLMAVPFGKTIMREVELKGVENVSNVRRTGGVVLNIIWFPFGLLLAAFNIFAGFAMIILALFSFITVLLIPVGVIYMANAIVVFRAATFIIFPIGAKVVSKEEAQIAMTVNEMEKRGIKPTH